MLFVYIHTRINDGTPHTQPTWPLTPNLSAPRGHSQWPPLRIAEVPHTLRILQYYSHAYENNHLQDKIVALEFRFYPAISLPISNSS